MRAPHLLLAAAIVVSICAAVWSFWGLFWLRIDPWLRGTLGRYLGVKIVWISTERGAAWAPKDGARRARVTVDALAVASRLFGIVTPVLVVALCALASGLSLQFGRVLLAVTLFFSAACARRVRYS